MKAAKSEKEAKEAANADAAISQQRMSLPSVPVWQSKALLQKQSEQWEKEDTPLQENFLSHPIEQACREQPQLQSKFRPAQKKEATQQLEREENNRWLPNTFHAGIEDISGFAMDDVKVHYNSEKSAPLQTQAYVRRTDMQNAAGHQNYLANESGHFMQKKQQSIQPTIQTKEGVQVNKNGGLENRAEVIHAKANSIPFRPVLQTIGKSLNSSSQTVQRGKKDYENLEKDGDYGPYKELGKTLVAAYRLIDQATAALGKGKNAEGIKSAVIGLAEVGITVATTLVGIPGVISLSTSGVAVNATVASGAQQGLTTGAGLGLGAVESGPVSSLEKQRNATTTGGAIGNIINEKVGNLKNCCDTLLTIIGVKSLEKIWNGGKLLVADYATWNKQKGVLIAAISGLVDAMESSLKDISENFKDVKVTTANKSLFFMHTVRPLSDIVGKYNEKAGLLKDAINDFSEKHPESLSLVSASAQSDEDSL